MPGLADAVEAILDAVVDAVAGEATSGGLLEEIETVVRGGRARPMPALPAIWVIPELATNLQDLYGSAEAWTLPVTLAALVKSGDPEDGGRQAARLAAGARRAAISARRLGLDDYVVDTISVSFDSMARTSETNRNLFWVDARIQVEFTVDEDDS